MDTFAPNYSVTIKSLTLTFSCTTTRCLLSWHVKRSGTLCCKNLSALSIRNALQSIESSIQVQFSKFLYMLNTLYYQYNTSEQMLSLPYIWRKDKIKWSAFEIQQGLEHHLVSLGMHVHTLPQWIIIVYYVNYICLHKQLVNTSISHLSPPPPWQQQMQQQTTTGNTFKSQVTGRKYHIRNNISCKIKNLVYLISCRECGLQYVGETEHPPRQDEWTLLQHKNKEDIKTSLQLTFANCGRPASEGDQEDPQEQHTVEKRERESFWIFTIRMLSHHGLYLVWMSDVTV